MNYLSLIFRIAAVLSAMIACILFFVLEGRVKEKGKEVFQLQTQLQTLTNENESASLEIAELEEKLAAKNKLVNEAKTKTEETKAEMVIEMQENQRVQNNLIESQRKIEQLEETTNRLRKELVNAENFAATASQESIIAQLSDRVEELTVANTELRDKIRAMDSTALDDVSEDDLAESTDKKSDSMLSDAEKLTVDEISAIKEETRVASLSISNGIIVLTMKKELDLKPGTVITLAKNPETIAKVKIININGSLAIANILPGSSLDDLAKNDLVKIVR